MPYNYIKTPNQKLLQLYLLLLLLVGLKSYGQITLSAQVTEQNGTAIPYANVLLTKSNDSNFIKGAITNENGKFEIEISKEGNYKLVISYIGFSNYSKIINVDLTKAINVGSIILTKSETALNEVIIRGVPKIIENKGNKLIFNVDKSPMKKDYNGMELLQRSPNVFIGIDDEILIRNEEVTVMINGRVSNLTGSDLSNYISNLRSDDVKNIEIQTHLSANTDGESSGGVINIVLKKTPIGFETAVQTSYTVREQSYNDSSFGVNLNYGAKKWNTYGSYNFNHSARLSDISRSYDYFTDETLILTKATNEGLGRKKHNYQFGFVSDISDKHELGIEVFGTHYNNPYIEKGEIQILENDALIENGDLIFNNKDTSDLYNATINYTWKIDTLSSNLKIFADYSKQDYINKNSTNSIYYQDLYQNNASKNDARATTDIFSTQADLEKNTKNDLKLKSGLKFTNTERYNSLISSELDSDEVLTSESTDYFEYNEQITAGYLSLSKTLQKSFVELGLRYENTDIKRIDLLDLSEVKQNYSNWFPSFYYSYDLSNYNKLSVAYSKRINRPYFRNLNNYVISTSDFIFHLGNPNLQPENINKYELSFKQKKQSLSAYYTRSTNSIVSYYYSENEIVYHQYINSGVESEMGLEYNRNSNITSWWYMNGSLSIFQRKFKANNQNEIFDWSLSGTVKLSNVFKINKSTSIDFSGYYIAPYKQDYNKQIEYYTIDLMLKKSFLNDKLICRIYSNDIFNILNYKNESNLESVKRTYSNKPLTQSLKFWLTYSFSNRNKISKRKNTSNNETRKRL